MKKIYMAPEMEILDTELEGVILGSSDVEDPGTSDDPDARLGGAGFDEDEEDF